MSDASSLAALSSSIAKLVGATAPSIVTVTSHRSRASGFVWKDGFVVTADEALADEGDVSVRLSNGETVGATVAGRDHTTDIALLKVDTKGLASAKLTQSVPPLGSLAVAVATDREQPAAALGMVSL